MQRHTLCNLPPNPAFNRTRHALGGLLTDGEMVSHKTNGYCWRTQKCQSLWIIHAFFEGKKAGEAYARKSGPGTLKEVRQQYPNGC
jgi:hypothetical protein